MIEWRMLLEPALIIGFTPIVVTFIVATIFQIYMATQLQGEVSFKEITQQRTADFVRSKGFTALVWASLIVAAFIAAQNVMAQAVEVPYWHVLAAVLLGMVIKTVVEMVGWKQDDMTHYSRLTAIQWVLALVAAGLGSVVTTL